MSKAVVVLERLAGPDSDEMGVPFTHLSENGEQFASTTVFVWPDVWYKLGEPDAVRLTIERADAD